MPSKPFSALVLLGGIALTAVRSEERPPAAPVRPVTETYHGTDVVDPYRYMENFDDPEVRAWVREQADYADRTLHGIPGRQGLLARIREIEAEMGWDLLPPGSERYEYVVKDRQGAEKTMVYAGYQDRPESWDMDPAKGLATEPGPWLDKAGKPIDWYAGKQYDSDVAKAKKVLAELDQHYPGATEYEIAGFFFWQGEKDAGNPGHASRYEENLVRFIKQLRKDFDAPDAKFVLATIGETTKGSEGPGGMILDAQLAVDGDSGKYPEFEGNVATIYTHPMAQGGSGNGHYGGKAEVYMDVGEAMGQAMVELLKKGN